jgi:hypothetical protein
MACIENNDRSKLNTLLFVLILGADLAMILITLFHFRNSGGSCKIDSIGNLNSCRYIYILSAVSIGGIVWLQILICLKGWFAKMLRVMSFCVLAGWNGVGAAYLTYFLSRNGSSEWDIALFALSWCVVGLIIIDAGVASLKDDWPKYLSYPRDNAFQDQNVPINVQEQIVPINVQDQIVPISQQGARQWDTYSSPLYPHQPALTNV